MKNDYSRLSFHPKLDRNGWCVCRKESRIESIRLKRTFRCRNFNLIALEGAGGEAVLAEDKFIVCFSFEIDDCFG